MLHSVFVIIFVHYKHYQSLSQSLSGNSIPLYFRVTIVDNSSIRLYVVHTCHLDNTLHRGKNSISTARHVQLVPEQIFNKLEVGRLDSRLSVFIIIFVQYMLYHGVRLVVRIQTAFKTIRTPGF